MPPGADSGRVMPEARSPSAWLDTPSGSGSVGWSGALPCSVDVAIACWPWGAYLGDDAVTKGVRMKISSWTRHDHNTMPPASKTTGNYVNSSLAKVEALKAGYDEAIMLAPNGLVAECTGENIFVARHGRHELTNLMLTTAQVTELASAKPDVILAVPLGAQCPTFLNELVTYSPDYES